MDVKEELIKQRLLNTKRTNEEIKANIEKSLLFEENNDLCKKRQFPSCKTVLVALRR